MTEPKYSFDKFWSPIWVSVWNVLGIAALAVCVIVVGYTIISEMVKPEKTSRTGVPVSQLSYGEKKSLQTAFNVLLANEKRPCAVKNKGDPQANVLGCGLFRIKLGVGDFSAEQMITSSGYFDKADTYEVCDAKEKGGCTQGKRIYSSRGGFSVAVHLDRRPDPLGFLEVTEVRLSFGVGTHPYFDADALRAAFIQIIGPPDLTRGKTDEWGQFGGPRIEAAVSEGSYGIRISDRSKVNKAVEGSKAK